MIDTDKEIGALYSFDVWSDGRAVEHGSTNPPSFPSDAAYRWVHLDIDDQASRSWINNAADEFVADALTIEDTRPRFARYGDGFLLNLRGVNLNPASDPEDMVSIRLYVSERLVISVRKRKLMAVAALRESLQKREGPVSTGDFISQLAEGLTERMAPVVDQLADEVDNLEESSFETTAGLRPRLAEIRRTLIILRRYIGPQREALARLASEGFSFSDDVKSSLRETVDRITRLIEEMDAVRERCSVLNDQLADVRAEEMNRNMMVLSVVAAIFLPLGLITGLLGVNIGGIPGTENPFAFAFLCIFMVAMGVAITVFFRKLKWI